MKSNVCKINKGTKDLVAILKESEKVALYNDLTHKQALQLRLICEEIDGMLPQIIDDFDGDFWIEFEDGLCKVNVSIKFAEFSVEKKEELITLSRNNKNAAAVGVAGKIRSVLENLLLDDKSIPSYAMSSEAMCIATSFGEDINYSHVWMLENYRNEVKKKNEKDSWDELEKSVIASVADDVVVGVVGKRADIIVTKKFA
jgi:hypothetical protein